MKALTEMKRKNPSLVFRYSFPQKLNFAINATTTGTSTSTRKNTTMTPSFRRKITRTKHPVLAATSPPCSQDATQSESSSFLISSDSMPGLSSTKNMQILLMPCEVSTTTRRSLLTAPEKSGAAANMTHSKKILSKAKKVSFTDCNEVWGIVSRKEFSAEERHEIWYSRDEYETIMRACAKQIGMLDRGKALKDKKFCARGLEANTRVQAGTKSLNRCLAYQAVLREQDRQIRSGRLILDDKEIAQQYSAASCSCQLWAHVVGLADQREAQDIQDESSSEEGSSDEQSCTFSSGSELQESQRIPDHELVARAA